jgi:hypothetical protein
MKISRGIKPGERRGVSPACVGMMLLGLGMLVNQANVRAANPKFLPDDTEAVITINVKQFFDSELVKGNKELIDQAKNELEGRAGDNPLMKFLKQAEFDVFRDLKSITVALNGGKDPTALIIEGKFNEEKFAGIVEEFARGNADALKIGKVAGRTIYEITPPGEKVIFASLVDGKYLVATPSKEGLADSISRISGAKQARLKKDFSVLLNTVNDKQSFYVVATGPALAKLAENAPIPNAGGVINILQQVDGLSIAVTINKQVEIQLGLNATDDATAKKMSQDLNGALLGLQFLVNSRAQNDEKFALLVDVVKTLRITNQGSNIVLRGTISNETIEKAKKKLP